MYYGLICQGTFRVMILVFPIRNYLSIAGLADQSFGRCEEVLLGRKLAKLAAKLNLVRS
jgi:hypothetical protein